MASVKGVNYTNITATPIVKADSEVAGGKIRVSYDNYEASSLASGCCWSDTINVRWLYCC